MLKYCITCQRIVFVEHDGNGDYHMMSSWNDCPGPFASCPPPSFPEEYLENVVCDMSPEELEQSNNNAKELQLELIGETISFNHETGAWE